jgi:predicted SnoaL-like aldol condensation-catalyzing enzyme
MAVEFENWRVMASDVEANKRAVVTSYTLALNDKDADAASVYLHPHYKQHNPTVADGIAGWRAMVNWIKTERPTFSVEIKRVIGEADFVVLHVHMKENDRDRGRAGVEIFRLEDGKIAEHWDILQPIPAEAANSNTMF